MLSPMKCQIAGWGELESVPFETPNETLRCLLSLFFHVIILYL